MRHFAGAVALTLGLGMLAVAVGGCKSAAPPTPLAELNAQQAHGHAVFQARCAMCHYDRQAGALHGPSLLGALKKPELPSGAAATDERVTATVVHGHGLMPGLGDTIDPQDVTDVVAYLHTL